MGILYEACLLMRASQVRCMPPNRDVQYIYVYGGKPWDTNSKRKNLTW
jgi:hypothetical protein